MAGDDAYREAKDFMRMIMPSHAKNVQLYKDDQPIFSKYQRRGPARPDVLAAGHPALRRLSGDQPDRSAGLDRRQLGPLHQGAQYRGHGAPDQSRSGRGSRPAAPPARSRRPHRHRLHRHDREPLQPGGGAQAQGRAQERPRPHPGRPHQPFRPDGNEPPAHPLRRGRELDAQVPGLRTAPASSARSRASR